MAVPVVQTRTDNTALNTTTLTLTKPSGVTNGDLLLLICGSEASGSNGFDDPPSGWNLVNYAGTGAVSASVGAFWRIADGSEGATVDVVQASATDCWGSYVRVSGADQTTPINATGADYTSVSQASHSVGACTTSVNECLAFGVLGVFGGDPSPFPYVGPPTWTKLVDNATGGGTPCAGTIGTLTVASAGSSGVFSVDFGEDLLAAAGFTFAIAPAPPEPPRGRGARRVRARPNPDMVRGKVARRGGVAEDAVGPPPAGTGPRVTRGKPAPSVFRGRAARREGIAENNFPPRERARRTVRQRPPNPDVVRGRVNRTGPRLRLDLWAREVSLLADLDVSVLETYRIIARNLDTGVETVLGTGTSLSGVVIANGRYMVRVEADGAYWRSVRFAREWPLTIVAGEIVLPLPPILNLTYSIVGDTVYVSWTWQPTEGESTPTSFGVWVSATQPVSTAGAPTQTITAVGPGGYTTTLPADDTVFYVAVASRLASQQGAASTIEIAPAEDIDDPSGQSARIPDGDWRAQEP